MSTPAGSRSPRRARGLLAGGAIVGIALAIAGLVAPSPQRSGSLPSGAAAMVDGVVIGNDELGRAVELLAADSKNEIREEDRQHVLDRLIDEELLVQRARDLGIDRHDRRFRSLLVQTLIDSIVAEAQGNEPSADDVEKFYREHGDYFARTDRLRVEAHRFAPRNGENDDATLERARTAAAKLRAHEDASELSDRWIVPLPNALLPASKLREYIGPTPTRQALELGVGEIGGPVRGAGAWYVLEVVERVPEEVPPLESITDEVRAEMKRRQGDTALRTYLDELRRQADVRVPPNEPPTRADKATAPTEGKGAS